MKRLPLFLASTSMAAAFAVAPVAPVIPVPPAHAASNIQICNHVASADDILAYRISSPFVEAQINQGSCAWINDDGGKVRVDVDLGGHEGDVDSYKKHRNSEPYTGCVNSENEASDPYSGSGTKTTYRTYFGLYCG